MPKAKPASQEWRNRIVGHDNVAPDQLLANPHNWRVHTSAQRSALSGGIADVGYIRSVTVNRSTGHIVDGHLRVELAIQSGVQTIPVEYVELTAAEEAEALLTIDPVAAMATSDKEQVAFLLDQVQSADAAVQTMLMDIAQKSGAVAAGAPNLIPTDDRYKQQYGVVVICDDEAMQERVYNELHESGYMCKVVVT